MKKLDWITVFVTVAIVSSIVNGYALSVLWGWFMVKTFGLPTLSIPAAIGVATIVSYLTLHLHNNKDERELLRKLADGIAWAIVKPAIALLTGWVVIQFM